MSSNNPLESLLRSMMQQGMTEGGQPAMFTYTADGNGNMGPFPFPGMGGNIQVHGMSGTANASSSGTQRGGGAASPGMGVGPSASPGNVYNGSMPPMAWIQREQQRIPLQFSATGSANLDGTRLREEGNEAFKAGRYEEAARYYTQAIAVDPDCEINYTNRSFAYFKMQEFTKSAEDAERAVQLNDRFFKGYYRLGLAQMALNEFTRALENLRTAWSKAPDMNKEAIRVAIAKCESKLARAPPTPLLMSAGASVGSPLAASPRGFSSRDESQASGYVVSNPFPIEPALQFGGSRMDLRALEKDVALTADARDRTVKYVEMYDSQRDIVECGERSAMIKQLISVATSSDMDQLVKECDERQTALRRAVRQQDSNGYCEAKRSRDATLTNLWEAASAAQSAITKLKSIAKEEQDFFSRFGPSSGTSTGAQETTNTATPTATVAPSIRPANLSSLYATPLVGGTTDDTKPASPLSTITTAAKPTGDTTSSSGTAGTELKALLRRRDFIHEAVSKAQKCFAETDAAARAFARSMKVEGVAMGQVAPLLEEATRLDTELDSHARQVAQTTTKELFESRLLALEQVSNTVSRITADKAAFQKTQREGDRLLEEEAKLEQQRLLRERQRIQIQAEVEWFKVRDEPESRIETLQMQVRRLQQQIVEIHEKQKGVQTRIMELVAQDHPELAWKSMANGSRILRLVKGSGLWQNLTFSDFQVVSTLSSTVNSKVYHAIRRGEHVAVKEIPVENEAARRRFQREVSIVASCNHPNIIRIKGVFFDGPFAYILLPYYRRGSLRPLLGSQESQSWVKVQDLFRQLASGVAYLHERGIVHADIKPSNILIADDGHPVIADFGIAKEHGALGVADVTITTTLTGTASLNGVAGTRQYMAPEQFSWDPATHAARSTSKSDMWALGLTMLEVAMQNAYNHDPSLDKPTLPVQLPEHPRIEVPVRAVGGDEKLAEAISATLVANPSDRPTAYDLLAYPYFSSSLSSAATNAVSSALSRSDERIDAVRSYVHLMRRVHPQKVLVSVVRNRMVESVRDIFEHLSNDDLLSPILVVFQGESGIDDGALTTEMLNLFYDQFITDKKGLTCAAAEEEGAANASASESGVPSALYANVSYLPAADADGVSGDLFELFGKVLLKSIIENRPLPIQLSSAVLKFLCCVAPSFADLEEYDPTVAASLKRLRLHSAADLEAAELTFAHFTPAFLQAETEDRFTVDTLLTPDNVGAYLDLRVKFDLVESRRAALERIRKGFFCEPSLEDHLKLLSPSDLLLLLCGQMHLAAQTIQDALEFQGFDRSSNTPKYLREVLQELSQNNLRRFVQLCTSTAAVPLSGAMKKIKVIRCADTQRLPVGHGCTNQLDLPDYNDKKVVQEKLEMALAHASDGFHIV